MAQERHSKAFSFRNYLCRRDGCDSYTVVGNTWIFLVGLQAANIARLPIVELCALRPFGNGVKYGYSAFVGTQWTLQHVPTTVEHALCVTGQHRILGVCVAAVLAEFCVLGSQGSRASQRAKKARRPVWLQIRTPF